MNKLLQLFYRVRPLGSSHEKIILKKTGFSCERKRTRKSYAQQKFRNSTHIILVLLLTTILFPITFAACGDKKITSPETCDNCTCHKTVSVHAESLSSHELFQPLGFNESVGIKVSYVVASFGHAMWNWLIDLWE